MNKTLKWGLGLVIASASIFGATAAQAATIADPQGVLLDTVDATMTADSPTLDLTNSAGYVANGYLSDDPQCTLDNINYNNSGPIRRYVALPIVVTTGGHFTFRIVNQSPEYNNRNDENPVSDPFLALYGTFTTSDLDAGLVGCNDDAYFSALTIPWSNGDEFPTNGVSNTNDRWSHFEAELEPGAYTAIFTTFIATDTINSGAWSYPQTVTFEYWGPECSIEGATCASAEVPSAALPATGIDEATTSSVASFALMTALAGLTVLLVLRRRARA